MRIKLLPREDNDGVSDSEELAKGTDPLDSDSDNDGWIDGNPEVNSIEAAFTNPSDSYSLELRRKLNTNEQYDVQFTEKKLYKFNVAILNDSHYEDHAISWTYALDLREEPKIIYGFPIEYFLLFSSLFGMGCLLKNNKKIQIRKG